MELANKVVVVTGGGSGIGAAIARAAVAEQARHVVVVDLDADAAQRVADEIGGTAAAVDVSDDEAIRKLVADTEDAHGPIGLFVSNAGYVTAAGLEDSNESIQKMWEVHCMAHIYAARAVLPSMIAQGEGYILSTASAAGLLTQLGSLAYSITKAAAVSIAEWIAISHHHQGIRASVLCPQAVATNIIQNSPDYDPDASPDDFEGGVASGDGVLDPADVAALCIETIRNETFLVLPHPEVATYAERKGADRDRWLAGMRRFQSVLYPDGDLPGDAISPL
ncbi:SDR family oxidoreductase [Ilumatobacter coccineus]|uniref:Putative oxidoreductase n=1 Tax=Ilumatobacter coccineus (strain NBRC 103263 / KCTC 29153 / YM16-304) TaxID=1313172 RepID=A0A6C7E7U2_ILUCY|nr:SDR family oxidoreductase [Ilumatobacter coccineus]BAN02500.1 putative oxidoreductase [Ilumatobacter coccineus YM16-304]